MDCVEGSKGGLGEGPRPREELVVDGAKSEGAHQLVRAFEQQVERQVFVSRCKTAPSSWDLGESQLAAHQVGGRKERSERWRLRLLMDELDERGCVRVEDGHSSAVAADFVKRAAQRVRVAGQLHRLRQP